MPAPFASNVDPVDRLRSVPVPIIVKLAEKKIEMGQLLGIGTGAIITFEKSCEDLLDLYVNNHLYCRGEAVKIGEKFGIKVVEVGSIEERVSAVLGAE
jgi:flagellar motor switch protein FliN/FliY